jgi:Transposase DDE domain
MPTHALYTWIARHISVRNRLTHVCVSYLLFLMIVSRKHSLEAAARFSGLHTSQFSKVLKNHAQVALSTLEALSKKQAKQLSQTLPYLSQQHLPWKIALLIDSTLQRRASLHPENAKTFNHGKGFVIGHQWTNIVLIINESLIPLPPIPFYSQRYCRDHAIPYQTEHDLVVNYINNLNLNDYLASHDPHDVVVLTDSGYDDKKIEQAIVDKHWNFIISVSQTRSVKSEILYLTTPKSRAWCHVAMFFRNHRRLKWKTIRFMTNGTKCKRMEFRIRHTIGHLRHVGKVQLVCSEPKKRPDGRRKYFACNDVNATARQIVLGYRLRWTVELFHKDVKMHLGFEDVATSGFDSVVSHVHWVYCAYLLLHMPPPGVPDDVKTIGARQRKIQELLEHKEKRRVLQKLTQIGGVERYKDELRQALAGN